MSVDRESNKSSHQDTTWSYRRVVFGSAVFCLGVAILWVTWQRVNGPTSAPSTAPAPPVLEVKVNEPPISREEIARIFESELMPLIENADRENIAAKDRAIQNFQDSFKEFRNGVPAFAEDMSGWGTRFGIVSNWTKDKWDAWWNENENSNRLGEFVHAKFRERVLSEEKLETAFSDSIAQYTADLTANRNALLSEVQIALASPQLPVQVRIPEEEFATFAEQTQQKFSELAADLGGDSVVNGVLAFVGGGAVGWGASQVTLVILNSLQPAVIASLSRPIITSVMTPVAAGVSSYFAATGLAAGGATVAFAAGGGAGGSSVGPVGTGVGIVVGLVVGGLTEWWMSAHFEEKMIDDITGMLDVMEQQIITGVNNVTATSSPGLDATFSEANQHMKRLMQQATLETMWERI